jgi:hypothetical protein
VLCLAVLYYGNAVIRYYNNRSNSHNTETPYDVVNDLEGVTLEIRENTLSDKGLTLVIKNVTPREYIFSPSYCVEQEINGQWHRVPYVTKIVGWRSSDNLIVVGNSVNELEINWEWLYGNLSSGNYRIIKSCVYLSSPGEWVGHQLSAEFTIAFPAY